MKPLEFKIPDVNMAALAEKLEKLNRRAVKLGLAPIESHVLGVEIRLERVTFVDPETGLLRETGRTTKRRIYSVQLIGDALKLPGWHFLGTLEHTPAGNVLRAVPGREIPESYRTGGADCDHCHKARRRKDTYVIQSESGEVRQIGHSCIRDFLGHVSPEQMGWMATIVRDLEALGSEGGSGSRPVIYTTDFLEVCAALTLERGFVSRAAVQAAPESGLRTTSSLARQILFPDPEQVRKGTAPTVEDTPESLELARASLEWAKSLVATRSDYEHNLRIISSKETLEDRDLGLLASLPAAYRKTVLKIERERKERAVRAVSRHFGTVGGREVFTLTLRKAVPLPGFRDPDDLRYLYLFEDGDGNAAAWFASSKADLEEGRTYEVKATVKAHGEYKGGAQTVLTRCVAQTPVSDAENLAQGA